MRIQFLLLIPSALAYPATFNFDSLPIRTFTPFSDTDSGITAMFTTHDQFRCFFVGSTGQYTPGFFSGNQLLDCHLGVNELDITFSEELGTVGLLFQALQNSAPMFILSAFSDGLNGSQVGMASATGTQFDASSFWTGSISFSGSVFDYIRLTSSAGDWAIDDLNVTGVVQVPEPAPLGLVGLILVLGLLRRILPSSNATPPSFFL
jgi:hypothetical protein